MIRWIFFAAAALAFAAFLAPVSPASAATPAVPQCANLATPDDASIANVVPFLHTTLDIPAVTARAAVVMDGETGRVLYGRNAHERLRPASTTKIMTGIIAIEHGDIDRTVIADVDGSAMPDSSVMGLRPGVPITMRDLLYGLLLPSGNDAAVQIAEIIDGSVPAFADEMNRKAAELHLDDTHFVNPHGLDRRQHYSSAYDLALLGRYAMANPDFARVVGTLSWRLSPPSDYDLFNGNSLLSTYPGADGIKIGWTEGAGWTLVASAVRDGRRVFVVVLDSKDRDADATSLFDWAFASYNWFPVTPHVAGTLRLAERLGVADAFVRSFSVC